MILLLSFLACNSEEASNTSLNSEKAEKTDVEVQEKADVKPTKSIDWQSAFQKRQDDYTYAQPEFSEFESQVTECKGWFGADANSDCLADCAVFSLNRYSYNMDHPENARPVEPQAREQLASVCK